MICKKGDTDFICNWLGNVAWTEALEWSGQKAYNAASIRNLTLSRNVYGESEAESEGDENEAGHRKEKVVGSFKSSGNFTFLRLYAGGHMIPHDQPEASLDMFNRWLKGEWWSS